MRETTFERAIEFARELIRIPSPPGGEGEVAERVLAELKALGYDDVWSDDLGNALGRLRGSGSGPTLMLSCHLDVVDPGDPLAWEHLPYGAEIAAGFLHGRGSMDIKGPLALQCYAAAAYARERRGAGDVVVAHTVFEERGGLGMKGIMEAGEVSPDVVVIGEATAGDVCIGHRGRAEIRVTIRGLAGHASAPDRARNATDPLGEVLRSVRDLAAKLPRDPILGASTIVTTGVSTTPASPNVIPDTATALLDWRVLPGLQPEDAVGIVRDWLTERVELPEGFGLEVRFSTDTQRTYTGVERARELFTPGFLLAPDHPVAVAAAGAVERALGSKPAVRPWTFATDGGHSCGVHGVPTIGFAPGEERYAHTNRERLELASAERIFDAYPQVLEAVHLAARR